MKKAYNTPVPLPGSSKAKSKPKSAPSKAVLSQEFIDDSDDSETEKAPQPKVVEKPKPTIAIRKPNGIAKTNTQSSTKPTPASKTAPRVKDVPRKDAPKQIGTQEDAEELSSSEQSDDYDSRPTRDTQTKLPGNVPDKDPASESDSESTSDSSSDESEANVASQAKPTSAQLQPRPSKPQSHAVAFKPTQTYVPPRGFAAIPIKDNPASRAAHMFENLEGKQIWHITAPAGVSLKELKAISMGKVMDGEAILDYKGTSYGFSKTDISEAGEREVLIPQEDGFKAVSTRPAQSFHLQAVVRLPELSSKQADPNTGSEAAASITRSTIRAPRPQVKGLKMRFLPIGCGDVTASTLGDSDSEVEVPQDMAGLAMPNGLNLPSRQDKRKHSEVNGNDVDDADASHVPSKKSKKNRTPEEIKNREERRAKKQKKRAKEAALANS